jgi:hypothetical protein
MHTFSSLLSSSIRRARKNPVVGLFLCHRCVDTGLCVCAPCRAIQAQYNELLHDPPPGINAGEHACLQHELCFITCVLACLVGRT